MNHQRIGFVGPTRNTRTQRLIARNESKRHSPAENHRTTTVINLFPLVTSIRTEIQLGAERERSVKSSFVAQRIHSYRTVIGSFGNPAIVIGGQNVNRLRFRSDLTGVFSDAVESPQFLCLIIEDHHPLATRKGNKSVLFWSSDKESDTFVDCLLKWSIGIRWAFLKYFRKLPSFLLINKISCSCNFKRIEWSRSVLNVTAENDVDDELTDNKY